MVPNSAGVVSAFSLGNKGKHKINMKKHNKYENLLKNINKVFNLGIISMEIVYKIIVMTKKKMSLYVIFLPNIWMK